MQPGQDARWEWIELTNVGRTPLRLGGYELRDNSSAITLPDIELPAGGAVVVAGVAAEIGEVIAVRLDGGLFNGLANAGDRVVLLTRDGALIDALSYGIDDSHNAPPLAAPGAGGVLRRQFAAGGTLRGLAIDVAGDAAERRPVLVTATRPPAAATDAPATGRAPEATDAAAAAAASDAEASPPAATATGSERPEGGRGANRAAWVALIVVALGALAGVGAFRLRELLRAR